MNTKRNIGKATKILLSEGPIALLKTLKRYVTNKYGPYRSDGSYRPDETEIAFNALNADTFKGMMIDVGAHYGACITAVP